MQIGLEISNLAELVQAQKRNGKIFKRVRQHSIERIKEPRKRTPSQLKEKKISTIRVFRHIRFRLPYPPSKNELHRWKAKCVNGKWIATSYRTGIYDTFKQTTRELLIYTPAISEQQTDGSWIALPTQSSAFLKGNLSMRIEVSPPDTGRRTDDPHNCIEGICDVLQGIIYTNDYYVKEVCMYTIGKSENGYVEVYVKELPT